MHDAWCMMHYVSMFAILRPRLYYHTYSICNLNNICRPTYSIYNPHTLYVALNTLYITLHTPYITYILYGVCLCNTIHSLYYFTHALHNTAYSISGYVYKKISKHWQCAEIFQRQVKKINLQYGKILEPVISEVVCSRVSRNIQFLEIFQQQWQKVNL